MKEQVRGRQFEAVQIEVTSRCIQRCVMCPRVALADRWPELDLPWEAFQRSARAFHRTKFVYLQGWGEPLLHPRLYDMIALAKDAGCRVGFTSNGMLLDLLAGKRLLALDLDLLAISIAGATRRTHESIRVGSDFPTVLDNVRRFLILKAKQRSRKPKVEIFFLMTKTNMAELPQAVDLAASLGVDELVATNLDYAVTPEHDDLKAFSWKPQKSPFVWFLEEARKRAQRAGLSFRPYPLDPEEAAVCEANPTKILFISCDGWVSPCNYMGLPGRSDVPRRFGGLSLTVPRLRFGNVLDQELLEIWESPAYRAFRRQFEERLVGNLMRALSATVGSGSVSNQKVPPPEPCRTCYKLYGL
ncbi:MAG: SPASM domain-containing protein [Candidatus Tectomicrobia bacterium]|uniref:SPASM domain-containing protein n=1 Tax=Tectimicrobiota bacterium TaxID=2528274 RepID=A0A932GPH5_UNCTE|nr:SPASM domain-containing protein [Candidatus Tectomicrobia bacterium]